MPIAVFKPSGFGRFKIYNKISENKELTTPETDEWLRIKERFNLVCGFGKSNNIKILIDAEESWIQKAVDDLILEMMNLYNKESVVVYNTLQTYRWDRLNYLKQIHLASKKLNFKLGIKLVRGAYMEKERLRASELGYKSPICKTKELTDILFNDTLKFILGNLNQIQPFIGTHNEESTALAVSLMNEYKISKNDNRVWFGQLYGMSDHISYNLAANGYNVAKYVPFGPVKDVMPYLIRRAEENTSVAGQTSRELKLIKLEKNRRKI
jgi:proline dehydrogenase